MMQRLAFVLSFLLAMTAAYHLPFSNQHLNILQRNRMSLSPLEAVSFYSFFFPFNHPIDPEIVILTSIAVCNNT